MRLYLVRSSLLGIGAADLRAAAVRAAEAAHRMSREGFRIHYLESTHVLVDGWFASLYETDSVGDVRLATERAAIPFDDIVEVERYSGESVHGSVRRQPAPWSGQPPRTSQQTRSEQT
jgi:hypothetical protein